VAILRARPVAGPRPTLHRRASRTPLIERLKARDAMAELVRAPFRWTLQINYARAPFPCNAPGRIRGYRDPIAEIASRSFLR
jgi:hypothetical protein